MIHDYLEDLSASILEVDPDQIEAAFEALVETYQREGTIYVVGNGGSAAVASHFVSDLALHGRPKTRFPIDAECLTDNISMLTASANDFQWSECFSQILWGRITRFDSLVCFSVSGGSENVIEASRYAQQLGASTVGFFGRRESPLSKVVQFPVYVPGREYELVEDIFAALAHAIVKEFHSVP